MSEKGPQGDVYLCPNHVVHGGESRNQDDLANLIPGCELQGGGSPERVSQDAESFGTKIPGFLFQKSLEGTL